MTAILIFFFAHYFLAVLAQTFFLHRYASHGMFTMNKFWERFFHIFTLVAQGPSFLEPYSYAVLHKMHHAHSDTPQDPHSPVQTKNLFHMMWQTKQIYSGILSRRVIPEPARSPALAAHRPIRPPLALAHSERLGLRFLLYGLRSGRHVVPLPAGSGPLGDRSDSRRHRKLLRTPDRLCEFP